MDDFTVAAALQALGAQAAIFQALLLLASAGHKALRWPRSRRVVRQFAGLPNSLAALGLVAVIAVELVAAALLVAPGYRAVGALLASVLWSLYLALILRAILEDRRDVDCGCSFGSSLHPLGFAEVARNVLLAALAAWTAWATVREGAVPAQGSQVLGGLALLALYGAVDQVLALRPLRIGTVA
jgi:hypothetical protein